MSTPSLFDAVILAGGDMPEELRTTLPQTERALIEIGGKTLVAHMIETLIATKGVGRVIVVGHEATLEAARQLSPEVVTVEAREALSENVLAGLRAAQTERALVCTCDIPLTQPATFEELLNGVATSNLDSAYPIVRRETMEAAFPGGKRTYAKCREGYFTGGNAFVLPATNLERLSTLIEQAFRARKNPLAVAKLLGFRFLVKTLAGSISLPELERKFSSLLDCRCGAVVMRDAAIAFDIDKLHDYEVAIQQLQTN